MNRSKNIGTAAESAVVRVARASGFPQAERRALAGSADVGDVLLTAGLVAEVKAGEAAKTASLGQIDQWLAETERERRNAGADVALLVVQRRGIGTARAELWDCHMTLQDVMFAADNGSRVEHLVAGATVTLRLHHALFLLRLAGWGDPLPVPRTGLTLRQPPAVDVTPRVVDDDLDSWRCACARPATVGVTHSSARCWGPEATS